MFAYKNKTHQEMQHGKLYKLQRAIVGRLDKKERIRLLQKKHLIFAASKIVHSGKMEVKSLYLLVREESFFQHFYKKKKYLSHYFLIALNIILLHQTHSYYA